MRRIWRTQSRSAIGRHQCVAALCHRFTTSFHRRNARRAGNLVRATIVANLAATRSIGAGSCARSCTKCLTKSVATSMTFFVKLASHVFPIITFAARSSSSVRSTDMPWPTDHGTSPTPANSLSSMRRTRPSSNMMSGVCPKHFIGIAGSRTSPTGSVSHPPMFNRATCR